MAEAFGHVATILEVLLLVPVALFFVGTAVSHVLTWYYFARYDRIYLSKGTNPLVSVIKPVKGVDQSAEENFRSFCEQNYPNGYEILFCVEGRADPAVSVIEEIIEEYPDRDIRLVFSDPEDAKSLGKMKNMIVGFRHSSHGVIVFSDSDARVPPDFLRRTVACLGDPRVGLGFSAPAYEGAEDWPAALMAVSANAFVLRLASMCLFGRFDGAVGTTMVTRREVIEEVGGLERFGRQASDDIPLAREIHNAGYRIHLLGQPTRVFHPHYTFGEWWQHLHRWLVNIRHYWPANFWITSVVDLAPWWVLAHLAVTLLAGGDPWADAGLLAAVLGVSVASAAVINARFVRDGAFWRYLWVVFVQEAVRLPLVVYSSVTSEVSWRGRRLRIAPDCTVKLVPERGERWSG
jgi:ceramide glucosyltransferase